MFTHKQLWSAFEAIAEARGLSLSALSKSAGLDATSFNPSKRYGPGGRERWPSTETLSRVLRVADLDMKDFAHLLDAQVETSSKKPQPSRRRSERIPTILEGSIRLGGRSLQTPCRIRDLSAIGARIWFSGPTKLPREFELAIPKLEQSLRVRLVWSRNRNHGVMFLEGLRRPSGGNAMGLLDALQEPDGENYLEVTSGRLAPPSQGAPAKRARRS